jgi:hypothetical protein
MPAVPERLTVPVFPSQMGSLKAPKIYEENTGPARRI